MSAKEDGPHTITRVQNFRRIANVRVSQNTYISLLVVCWLDDFHN